MIEPAIPSTALAIKGLAAKLRAAIRAAWIDGKDFTHGPFEVGGTDPFSTQSLFDVWKVEVTCKGGPVEPAPEGVPTAVIHGWSYYKRPDFSESELRRFSAGRHDWRDADWQDHCGMPGCEFCTGEMPPVDHL